MTRGIGKLVVNTNRLGGDVCIAPGCTNEVVRVFVHRDGVTKFAVCAFHGQAIIKHGSDEQVRRYLFCGDAPEKEARQ